MVTSDKVVTAINGTPVPGSASHAGGNTSGLPNNTSLNLGDKLSFSRIDVCNSGQTPATGIKVTDTMINLAAPSGGWVVKYYDSAHNGTPLTQGSGPGTYSVSGNSPNQVAFCGFIELII